MRTRHTLATATAVAGLLALGLGALAQAQLRSTPTRIGGLSLSQDCCTVISVDRVSQIVTVRDSGTRRVLRLKTDLLQRRGGDGITDNVTLNIRTRDRSGEIDVVSSTGATGRLSWACTDDYSHCACMKGADCDAICKGPPTNCDQYGMCECAGDGDKAPTTGFPDPKTE